MLAIEPVHVIGVAVSFVLIYQSVALVRTRRENILEFLLWVAFGTGLLVYTVASMLSTLDTYDAINAFLRSLGFGTGERGLLFLSVITLFLLVLYTYTMLKTNRREITDLQQNVAVLRHEIERLEGADDARDPPGRPRREVDDE